MEKSQWISANNKLKWLIFKYQREDVYLMLNTLMPLKRRLEGGERSLALYHEIMSFRGEIARSSGKRLR